MIEDAQVLAKWRAQELDRSTVPTFVPGPGIQRLPNLRFDVDRLQEALVEAVDAVGWRGDDVDKGFGVIGLTRRPGTTGTEEVDLSGRYWTRPDDTYEEVAREDIVEETAYTEFVPELAHTYFAEVHAALSEVAPIGRMRIARKAIYNCNSWHRDPEPRLHIPLVTNPGSLFVVNHHVTHLPADGSVYFTDTRGYHTAMNGGAEDRIHIVAALP